MNDWLFLLLCALACYRLALLLSSDSGPYRAFSKLRSFLKRESKKHPAVKDSDIAKGMECIRCNSIWIASPLATYAFYHDSITGWWLMAGDTFLLCMALSACAILFHRLLPPK